MELVKAISRIAKGNRSRSINHEHFHQEYSQVKGALYIIQILCRRYTFWSDPAGLTIADPPE